MSKPFDQQQAKQETLAMLAEIQRKENERDQDGPPFKSQSSD